MSLGKILLVSHNFPPTAGPESHLVRMNAAYLQRQGWDIRIVTTTSIHLKQQMDHSLLAGFSDEIIVDRVTSPDAALAERFPKLGKFALGWLGTNVLPEVYLSWQFPATKVGMRVLKQWKPDIIYSRATKHVSNVVGWQLKARTGLPWVAHFSDPWICGGMRMRPLQKMIGRFWERRILRDADAVVFVSDQAAQRVMKNYPSEWRKRVHVIPHGYEEHVPFALQDQARKAASSTASRPLRIIHAGAFYPGMRGPEPLIAALKLLSQRRQLKNALEIDCIGVDTSYYQQKVDHAGVSDVLRLHTAVSFDECQKRITESDVILIIDTPGFGGVFLPTKLIEAFAFKKVVLGIAETDSATASVLRDVEQPLADIHDPQSIAAELESILNRWQSGNLAPDATQCAKFEQFQIDQVNQKLSNVLNSIIHKKYG